MIDSGKTIWIPVLAEKPGKRINPYIFEKGEKA